jgi:ribosome-binding factor A
MSSTRQQRMARLLKEELSRIIRAEINDPRLGLITIVGVETTPDLHIAHIYVSSYGTPEEQDASIATLQRATGFLRGELGKQVEMRYTPQLVFHLDRSIERGARVFEILHEVVPAKEEKKEEENDDQS